MARKRNCRDCKKELVGKYYLITGLPHNGYKASRANYCASCVDKWKQKEIMKVIYFPKGYSRIIEKEVGDKIEDEISEFEDKWEKHQTLGIKKNFSDDKTLLSSIQKARQELEPYLQKSEIVEKSWERGYEGYSGNLLSMSFYYLFKKDARDKDYKQKIVQPAVEEILGGKLDGKINTELEGNIPGFSAGRAEGDFKINGKSVSKYWWVDGDEGDYRRLMIIFLDNNKLALQSFLKSLSVKEKELTGKSPADNQQNNNNNPNDNDNSPPPKTSNQNEYNNSDKSNYALWISLSVGVVILFLGLTCYFSKKKKKT
ncbi:MAG: hypothetical protein MRERV_6c022 [Mycoplasmataceae bacterium RV_VA103A]|nr:MAG: hypothetical protein MRERV_6c022 [Mycoplasmataceae bacterium RV_VA103A]